ncbi:hypothetical protein ACQP00_20775 [Dactylosporangium sp. CS-047395]|uniref:hypothetical protein n=1 Tax=Dactylosporangium sp. CS-047395 TaxID=3239936 RepID=UPI003D8DB8E8
MAQDAMLRELTQELFTAVNSLRVALWMAWGQPKVTWLWLEMAALEYLAAQSRGGLYAGLAEGMRVLLKAGEQDKNAALAVSTPVERILAATARAALIPDSAVRQAALELGTATTVIIKAYKQANPWRRAKQAAQARTDAVHALYAALGRLLDAINAQIYPVPQPRRWWRLRRRAVAMNRPSALGTAVPALPASDDG